MQFCGERLGEGHKVGVIYSVHVSSWSTGRLGANWVRCWCSSVRLPRGCMRSVLLPLCHHQTSHLWWSVLSHIISHLSHHQTSRLWWSILPHIISNLSHHQTSHLWWSVPPHVFISSSGQPSSLNFTSPRYTTLMPPWEQPSLLLGTPVSQPQTYLHSDAHREYRIYLIVTDLGPFLASTF